MEPLATCPAVPDCPVLLKTAASAVHVRLQIRHLKYEQRCGEPKFETMKRQLEGAKPSHRGTDGSFRRSAHMDRHRQMAADSAIERQLEAQSMFRTQSAYLQSLAGRMHGCEVEKGKLCAALPAACPVGVMGAATNARHAELVFAFVNHLRPMSEFRRVLA